MPRLPSLAGVTHLVLELDGDAAGAPESAQGGDAVGEVVVSPPGPDGVQRKHLGDVHYTDIVLTCGIGMEEPFWTWLSDTLTGNRLQRSGVLRILDLDGDEREQVTFTDALVTEIGFPALDAASRDVFHLSVRISADVIQRQPGSGGPLLTKAVAKKKATVSNFSVSLDGLDLKRAARVGPLIIRRPALDAPLEVPDLELTLAETGSDSIVDWHRKFVIDGDNGDAEEKSGSIMLLDAAGKQPLLRLDLVSVGIFALEREAAGPDRDAVSSLTARMYCEELRPGPGGLVQRK